MRIEILPQEGDQLSVVRLRTKIALSLTATYTGLRMARRLASAWSALRYSMWLRRSFGGKGFDWP